MNPRANKPRIKVDLRWNRILVGRRFIKEDFVVIEVFRYQRRTKSIELLSRLANGDWLNWDNTSAQRNMVRWVENALRMINEKHGTDFRLEFRALHIQQQVQIGLVGG